MMSDFFGQSRAQTSGEDPPSDRAPRPGAPLAERMRPGAFDDVVGQDAVAGSGAFLPRLIEKGSVPSLIFWGPPGCGKTTLATLIAQQSEMAFRQLSAVTAGIKDVKLVIEAARGRLDMKGRRTILFVDEIHRFNKAQQDAFLPHIEDGTIVFFGATTENPSFSVISPLLSRCRVVTLHPLETGDLVSILSRALSDKEQGLGHLDLAVDETILEAIARTCDGDARRALNLLEQVAAAAEPDADGVLQLSRELLSEVVERTHLVYDASGEEHFNLISAFHKSMRSSDIQGSLYWLTRMLASGEDPLYIARRLVRFASEDVGLADPQALPQALAATESFRMLGSPEGELALAQATIYLAAAPKSDSLYVGMKEVMREIKQSGSLPVPMHMRNAPTKLMKEVGYGKGYDHAHSAPDHFSGQLGLPESLRERELYKPGIFGFEKEIAKRMEWWEKKRKEREK